MIFFCRWYSLICYWHTKRMRYCYADNVTLHKHLCKCFYQSLLGTTRPSHVQRLDHRNSTINTLFGADLGAERGRIRFIVTSFAVQFVTQKLVTPGFRLHPGAANQRWIMAHMLAVVAGKYRQPIPILILLKGNDFLFHFFTCAPSP